MLHWDFTQYVWVKHRGPKLDENLKRCWLFSCRQLDRKETYLADVSTGCSSPPQGESVYSSCLQENSQHLFMITGATENSSGWELSRPWQSYSESIGNDCYTTCSQALGQPRVSDHAYFTLAAKIGRESVSHMAYQCTLEHLQQFSI